MTRREAIKLAGLAAMGAWTGCASAQGRRPSLKLGVASYTLAKLPPNAVIAELRKMDIHYVTLANPLSFTVRGSDGIALMAGLDMEGICASSGSACSAGSLEPSHVILALGKKTAANSLVRFSLGRGSSPAEVEQVIAVLPEVIARAQKKGFSP